jgi:hypothetical protein
MSTNHRSWNSFFKGTYRKTRSKTDRRGMLKRLMFEQLEARSLLTVFAVNTTTDTVDINPGDGLAVDASGNTSLRAAVMEANALPTNDTINLPAGTYLLTLAGIDENAAATGDLDIADNGSITINGAGAVTTIIDANGIDRVFDVQSDAVLSIDGSTITGGWISGLGGGFSNGLHSTLHVTNSAISGNSSNSGGAFYNLGTLDVTNSTVSGNSAEVAGGPFEFEGGGFLNFGTLNVTNSTISGNSAYTGGGFYNDFAYLTLMNSTVSDNSAVDEGGGFYADGALDVTNSIVAGNLAPLGPDVSGRFRSGGYNLVGDESNINWTATATSDQVGTAANPIDPLLGPLQNNGGPTATHQLLAGSPAIDAGDPLFVGLSFDQRGTGFNRIVNGTVDIGAFEFGAGELSTQDRLAQLIIDVADPELNLNGGNINALTVKLQNATDKLNQGNITAGVNKIESFINQVNAFVNSGKLTQAQADTLIAAANTAIDSAGGGGAGLVTVQTSAGSSGASTQPVSNVGELVVDTLTVYLDDSSTGTGVEQHDALQSAISSLNASLGAYGVALVEVASAADAVIRIEIAADSACGSAADGVLGCAIAGEITLLSGWDWYLGADANAIAASQYDFRTILTHELGHSVGLAHSGDADSVMHEMLSAGVTHHALTDQDLSLISGHTEEGPAALRAAGWSKSDAVSLPTFVGPDTVSNRAGRGVAFDRNMSYDTLSPPLDHLSMFVLPGTVNNRARLDDWFDRGMSYDALSPTVAGVPMNRRDGLVADYAYADLEKTTQEISDAKQPNDWDERLWEDDLGDDKVDWSATVDEVFAELEEPTET